MTMIDVPCEQCAGEGWKNCTLCPGDGQIPCKEQCAHGTIRCRAECNYGWSTTLKCQYCKGGEANCKACNPEGYMLCESCNPFTHGNIIPDRPGWIRCPANCDAGFIACPICALYKWGKGKIGCDDCKETGLIAVEVDDPPSVA